jgi:glycosyltransferase involved in cell wall biosynthesis
MGVKFVFDMRGFWPEERVDGGLWNLSNPIYKMVFNYFKSKEAAFVQHADAIISLTEAGKKIILSWPNMQYSKKITVIPCSVDMQLFSREYLDSAELNRIQTSLQSPMVVGYYGSLGTWYMLEEMLDQFKAIQLKIPQAKFLMVSNDPWIEDYNLLLTKKQIDKSSIYFTNSPRKLMPYYIANTHVALFFIKACYSKISSSPTKHGEIMSLGIPLITNSGVGDIDAIVQSTQSGYILPSFDATSYQLAAASIDQLLLLDPSAIRNACKKYYSLESALDKYENIYKLLH